MGVLNIIGVKRSKKTMSIPVILGLTRSNKTDEQLQAIANQKIIRGTELINRTVKTAGLCAKVGGAVGIVIGLGVGSAVSAPVGIIVGATVGAGITIVPNVYKRASRRAAKREIAARKAAVANDVNTDKEVSCCDIVNNKQNPKPAI